MKSCVQGETFRVGGSGVGKRIDWLTRRLQKQHRSAKQQIDPLEKTIESNNGVKNDPDAIPGALRIIKDALVPINTALKTHLREFSYHLFCNSALFIKYRMTAEKSKTMGHETTAYGLAKETVENPFVNPGRNRASSDMSDGGSGAGGDSRRRLTGDLAIVQEGAKEGA